MSSVKTSTRLRELTQSGYEVATGQPDIRGWDVREASGRKIGKVRELIFDGNVNKVRYMVVDILNVQELELEKRTILIPIGLAEIDVADDDVILQNVTPFQLRALPQYDKDQLGAKTERDISEVFGRQYTLSGAALNDNSMDNAFYEHEHFNEHNLYKRRYPSETKSGTDAKLEEMRLRLQLAKEEELKREQASLNKDADLQDRVTFNDPDDIKKVQNRKLE